MSSLTAVSTREVTIAHSPDSDDAFMFYGLAKNLIPTGRYRFRQSYGPA